MSWDVSSGLILGSSGISGVFFSDKPPHADNTMGLIKGVGEKEQTKNMLGLIQV